MASDSQNSFISLGLSLGARAGAAVLLENGRVLATALEQRPFGARGVAFPVQAVKYCLERAQVGGLAQVNALGLQSRFALDWTGFLADQFNADRGWLEGLISLPAHFREVLHHRSEIRRDLEELGGGSAWPELAFVADELALARGLWASRSAREQAILILDLPFARGATGLWMGNREDFRNLWLQDFPQSWELLLHNLSSFCGFRGRMGERQFLQLAEYGEPRFVEWLRGELINLSADGQYQLSENFLVREPQSEKEWVEFQKVFLSEPRFPEQPIGSREIDLAHSYVVVLGEWLERLAAHLRQDFGLNEIAMRGQGALFEKVKRLWREKSLGVTLVQALPSDEPLLMAAGSALEATALARGHVPQSEVELLTVPLELRPAELFQLITRPPQ